MTDSTIAQFKRLEELALGRVEEAMELRHGKAGDPDGKISMGELNYTDPRDVLSLLHRVRMRSDRVDEIRAQAAKARGTARRAESKAKFDAEIRYDTAMSEHSLSKRDYTSAKELHAKASMDALDERRVAHHLSQHVMLTQETYEIINQIQWELSSIRDELREMLRTIRFESSLDH